MAIHFKFKSAKDFDSVPVEGGHCLSLVELKARIFEKLKLGTEFDLAISNAQTNEEYVDGSVISENSSVLLRRIPGTRPPALKSPPEQPKVPAVVPDFPAPAPAPAVKNTSTDWADEYGVDLYEDVQISKAQLLSQAPAPAPPSEADIARAEEEARIKAFCDASASDWERQTQQAFVGGRGHGRGGGQGRGGGGFVRKVPPEGYVCHRCNEPGHFIQHCPTNKDPAYNIRKVRLPTGIPRTMLVANPSGTYALPNGEIATLRPNEELFQKEVGSLPSSKAMTEVPAELRCPLCKDVLKDAVLTSKCCFKSYCDQCIRTAIIGRGRCVCGAANILADSLLPNKTLRDAIERLLDSNAASSSGVDNPGSRSNIPDMQSALPLAKAGSPSSSVSVKEKPSSEAVNPAEIKTVQTEGAEIGAVQTEGAEVNSATTILDTTLQEDNNKTDEQVQPGEKMNKLKRRPPKQMLPAGPMMPYGAPYWPSPAGMPMGDGYMMPYGGPFPYPMMPDSYSYQGMAPPAYPPREYGPGYPAMSREEFEAKKAEARRRYDYRDERRQYERPSRSDEEEAERRGRSSRSSSDPKRRREESDGYRRSSSSYDSRYSSSSHQRYHQRDREDHHHQSSRRREEDDQRRDQDYERDYDRDYERNYEGSPSKSRRVSVFLRVKPDESERHSRSENHRSYQRAH